MNVSLLQSQIALNCAAINKLQNAARNALAAFKQHSKRIRSHIDELIVGDLWCEHKRITKLLAKYAKLQKALKKQIAEIVYDEQCMRFYLAMQGEPK